MLAAQLRQDLTTAMKARDKVATSTIRLALGAIREAEVAGAAARTLSDEEVLAVLRSELKKRAEAAEAYDGGGRPEKAAAERAEAEILARYLPAALDEAQLEQLVDATLAAGGWTAKADMGKAMRDVQAAVDGRADGRRVAEMVKARLS